MNLSAFRRKATPMEESPSDMIARAVERAKPASLVLAENAVAGLRKQLGELNAEITENVRDVKRDRLPDSVLTAEYARAAPVEQKLAEARRHLAKERQAFAPRALEIVGGILRDQAGPLLDASEIIDKAAATMRAAEAALAPLGEVSPGHWSSAIPHTATLRRLAARLT